MLEKILVPLDGSDFGEQGVQVARALVRKAGVRSELHLVHVHGSLPVYLEGIATVNPDLESDREELEREYLQVVARNVGEDWPGPVEAHLLNGAVAEAVESYVEREDIGLLVMSSHGRGGISRLWLGSVADRLIRRTHRPLIVFRPREEGPPTGGLDVREILVPLDGSHLSEAAVPAAETLARETGARIRILRVLPPYFVIGDPGLVGTLHEPEEALSEREETATAYVEGVAGALRERGVEAEAEILSDTGSATGILEVASRQEVDLIAMATLGRGGFARAVMGSVADKVVRGAGCPVLLVRPRREEEGA